MQNCLSSLQTVLPPITYRCSVSLASSFYANSVILCLCYSSPTALYCMEHTYSLVWHMFFHLSSRSVIWMVAVASLFSAEGTRIGRPTRPHAASLFGIITICKFRWICRVYAKIFEFLVPFMWHTNKCFCLGIRELRKLILLTLRFHSLLKETPDNLIAG